MTDIKEKPEKGGIQVISRAAMILRSLKTAQSGMSLGQLAQRTNLPRSTVQRITGALLDEGLLVTDINRGGLRLGPELSALASAAQYSVVDHCRSVLGNLSQRTGETTDLAVLRGDSMIFLDQVQGSHRLTTVSMIGAAFTLTNTANGKACLAMLPESDAIRLMKNELKGNDKGKLEKLLVELEEIRSSGLAYDVDEHSAGICAIGFAFKDWGGNLHAISIPVPSFRFNDEKYRVESALLAVIDQVRSSFT